MCVLLGHETSLRRFLVIWHVFLNGDGFDDDFSFGCKTLANYGRLIPTLCDVCIYKSFERDMKVDIKLIKAIWQKVPFKDIKV